MKVITNIIGGMGNQLFQYAYGLHVSRALSARLLCDVRGFATYDLHSCMLGQLDLPIEPADANDLRPLTWTGNNRYFSAFNKRLLNFPMRRTRYTRDHGHVENLDALRSADWIYLDGYWQQYHHLQPIREELLRLFRPKSAVPEFNSSMQELPTVGVHIRRGDYVSLSCVLPIDYYRKAFAVLTQKVGREVIPIIFSDDPQWAQTHVRLSPRQIVRGKESNLTDFVHFSACRHQIIANSTFSWWAAWLNDYPGKQVVAPKDWLREDTFEVRRLVPKEWTII